MANIISFTQLSQENQEALSEIRGCFEEAKRFEDTIADLRVQGGDRARMIMAELGVSSVTFPDGYSVVWSVGERGSLSEQRLKECMAQKGIDPSLINEIVEVAKKMTPIDNCYGKQAKEKQ